MADEGSPLGSGSANGQPYGDTSMTPYQRTGAPTYGTGSGMVTDTAGNQVTPIQDPDPKGLPTGGPNSVGTQAGGSQASTVGAIDPTTGLPNWMLTGRGPLPPTTDTAQAPAAPTAYDLYTSRGGAALSPAQQAALAQTQSLLGEDYSHLSNPIANIASALNAGRTPQQIADAVQGSRAGNSPYGPGIPYDLSQSHSGGVEAFNSLRGPLAGMPAMGIYDNGSPAQVAQWQAKVNANPLVQWSVDRQAKAQQPITGQSGISGGHTVGGDLPGRGGGTTTSGGPTRGGIDAPDVPAGGGGPTTPGSQGAGGATGLGASTSQAVPGNPAGGTPTSATPGGATTQSTPRSATVPGGAGSGPTTYGGGPRNASVPLPGGTTYTPPEQGGSGRDDRPPRTRGADYQQDSYQPNGGGGGGGGYEESYTVTRKPVNSGSRGRAPVRSPYGNNGGYLS